VIDGYLLLRVQIREDVEQFLNGSYMTPDPFFHGKAIFKVGNIKQTVAGSTRKEVILASQNQCVVSPGMKLVLDRVARLHQHGQGLGVVSQFTMRHAAQLLG